MVNPFQKHLLYCLSEECSEVIQAVSKILRFGNDEDLNSHLAYELLDVRSIIEMLESQEFNTMTSDYESYMDSKKNRTMDYFTHEGHKHV